MIAFVDVIQTAVIVALVSVVFVQLKINARVIEFQRAQLEINRVALDSLRRLGG